MKAREVEKKGVVYVYMNVAVAVAVHLLVCLFVCVFRLDM